MAMPAKPKANIPTDKAITFHSMRQNYNRTAADLQAIRALVKFFRKLKGSF